MGGNTPAQQSMPGINDKDKDEPTGDNYPQLEYAARTLAPCRLSQRPSS